MASSRSPPVWRGNLGTLRKKLFMFMCVRPEDASRIQEEGNTF